MRIYRPSPVFTKSGLLVAAEGLDGAGKTTLCQNVVARLHARRAPAVVTNWNDTTEIYNLMMRLNASGSLDRDTRCIFGAVELAARYHYVVRPALHRGDLVLAPKYLVSALAHALIRGHPRDFVERVYDFALEADLTLYIDLPPEVCLRRKQQAGTRIGFWEAGLDLTLGLPVETALERYQRGDVGEDELAESFTAFQGRLAQLHRELLRGSEVAMLDGTLTPKDLLDAATTALDELTSPSVAFTNDGALLEVALPNRNRGGTL
jgi:thymidylate kinase